MIQNLSIFIAAFFALTTVATLLLFYWTVKNATLKSTAKKASAILYGLTVWLILQACLTLISVYRTDLTSIPPKLLLLGILPIFLTIAYLFITRNGRKFIDSLPLVNVTYLNIVRVPVEIVLWWLFLNQAVPKLMTFEGRNFDVFSGLTAPFVAYFGFTKGKLGSPIILLWNFFCLGLLLNILVNALLSAPTPLQKFAFDQPNIAILNFPFSWLPTFIVPIILFGHLVSIRQLIKLIKKNNYIYNNFIIF